MSSILATRAHEPNLTVAPQLAVLLEAIPPAPVAAAIEGYSVARAQNPADEGGVEFGLKQRDFSVHVNEEQTLWAWAMPSWARFQELNVVVLILGDTDNNYCRNTKGMLKVNIAA
jgi:hypothetical protein